MGLAFTRVDPSAIIGFYPSDAGVSHIPKELKPSSMDQKEISQIIRGEPEIANSRDGELAIKRYEPNIETITKRNWRRESTTRLYCSNRTRKPRARKKVGCCLSKINIII